MLNIAGFTQSQTCNMRNTLVFKHTDRFVVLQRHAILALTNRHVAGHDRRAEPAKSIIRMDQLTL